MKRISFRVLLLVAGLILVVLVLTASLTGQEPSREQVLTQMVISSLLTWHCEPPADLDLWSEKAFDLYLRALDYNKRFFTKADLQTLTAFRFKLDDEVRHGTQEFFTLSWEILSKRIREVQGYTDTILNKPFTFTVDEYLETDPEKRDYPRNGQELKELWRKVVKAQTLSVYIDLLMAEGENKADPEEKWARLLEKPFQPAIEEKARAKVRQDLNRAFRRLLTEKQEDRYARYLNALTSSFDPHTNYLPPKAKQDLDIQLSGVLEGIGATLQEDGDYIKVVEIIPGGPSWRQGKLKEGDIILKVAQGAGEPVDLINMPVDEAVRYIRGKKGTEVTLTVKKMDGQIEEITILRDIVVLEETYAKAVVIKAPKAGPKVGYIALPSFYRDFNALNGRSSSDDVRKELEKLKKAEVEGVILDLRNNKGGALDDAVKMAGLFIESGPVVQAKDQKGKIVVLQDPDPEVVYAGPLVVLINSLSASASEILAAALQDYGRAVIVGSPHSFGKGTVQGMVNLDYLLDYLYPRQAAYKPLGTIKLTEEKYYRINGGATQLKGVQSDLVLPDPYAFLEIGERYYDYVLPWDQVQPLTYQKWTGNHWDLATLKANSAQRLAVNPYFALVQKNVDQIRKQQEETLQPLQLAKHLAIQQQLEAEVAEINAGMDRTTGLDFKSLSAKEQAKEELEREQEWVQQLEKDFYLEEAVNVLQDMIAATPAAAAA
ncbi:MAG TPA: carboxy terminal-processing peptidase [Firmicutes bacterium]|jgi:carboxyl-terminal processing protease|nr:carboxy terminal-processing peptidase [Bacillota bacterium]